MEEKNHLRRMQKDHPKTEQQSGSAFEPDAHATYIVDLACAIIEKYKERFLLIVPNEGAVENFRPNSNGKSHVS